MYMQRSATPPGVIRDLTYPWGTVHPPRNMTKTNLNLLEFYDPQRANFFLTGITKWWWFPDESGGTTLVVSVKSSDTTIWLVAYTILVTLIFMAACDLATAFVLTTLDRKSTRLNSSHVD